MCVTFCLAALTDRTDGPAILYKHVSRLEAASTPSTLRQQFVSTSYKMGDVITQRSGADVVVSRRLPINEPENLKQYLCKTLSLLSRNPPSIPYRQVGLLVAMTLVLDPSPHLPVYPP